MKLISVNPSTGENIGEVAVSSSEHVKEAVFLAKNTFNTWKNTSVRQRIDLMKKFLAVLEKEKENFTELIMKEVGKPRIEAETEILDSQACIDYYCKEIKNIEEKHIDFEDKKFFPKTEGCVCFMPHGAIGLITPWNYPLSLPMWTIIPALLTGNTVVFKPSENASLVGQKIDEAINKIFPKNVFNTIYGADEVGKILVKSGINKLFFTGSVKSGKHVLKNIGLKPVALETGSNDSAIVCKDAEMDFTVDGIVWGTITNAGQVCISIEKVYVLAKIADIFINKVVEKVEKLRAGIDFGPLINQKQMDKVEEHIKDATAKGAKILTGGKKIKGTQLFFEPTVLVNATEDMKIMSEETFGPVIPIKIVKDEAEAIELTNKSKYGLSVSIWTKDIEKGRLLSNKIDVGMVWINDVNLPFFGGDYWGGTKLSGTRTSESKIMQCLKAKTVISYHGREKREWWYPYK